MGDELADRLRGSGYRLTAQRQLVLRAVEELGHATPDEVLGHVRSQASAVNASTVYRTLEEQIGYEWKKADASRPWLIVGSLLAMTAAAGSLTAHRRIP